MSAGQATGQVAVRDAKSMRYVARQPIFDREARVFGYELLFRDSLENCFTGDADEASRARLDRSLVMGLDVLCDGRRAFLNCTRDTLIKEGARVLGDGVPKIGAHGKPVLFLHPKDFSGALVEIEQS